MIRQALAAPNRHWEPTEVLTDLPASETGAPNVAFAYSNTNYTLLGQIVETVTGQSLPAVLRAELFDPAGLVRISFQDAEPSRSPLGRWTSERAGSGPFLPTRSIASLDWAAGAIAADAASIARWGYLLFGGHVLDEKSLTAMLPSADPGYGLGAGSTHLVYRGLLLVGDSGGTVGYSSWLGVSRDEQLAIAVLAPAKEAPLDVIGQSLFEAFLEAR